MTIRTLVAPVFEPVSLAEAKGWIGWDDTGTAATDAVVNTNLNLLIKAMREYAENLTQRAFIERQLRLYLDDWPYDRQYGAKLELPFPPLVSVDAFKYTDTDGALQTLAADQYVVHSWHEPAWVIPAWQVTWPTIRLVPGTLQIDFTCGYAPGSPPDETASQEVLPASLRLWMQARLATLYENREQLINGNQVEIPRAFADGLLDSLIIGTRIA